MFLTAVKVIARVSQQWDPAPELLEFRQLLGQEELVLHGGHRRLKAIEVADLMHPVAAGVDDVLTFDVALVRVDDPTLRGLGQADAISEAVGLATVLTSGVDQTDDKPRRVDVTIDGIPQTAGEPGDIEQRVGLGHLARSDHLEVDAHALCHADKV